MDEFMSNDIQQILMAALEQCSLRRGKCVESGDIARAVFLVAPEQCPVDASIIEVAPRDIGSPNWSENLKPILRLITQSTSTSFPERVIADIVSLLPEASFSFRVVQTTGWWRHDTVVTRDLLLPNEAVHYAPRFRRPKDCGPN